MAQTLNDDEERDRRIEEIGKEFLANDDSTKTTNSTRKIAEEFSENKYTISNATVYSYIILFSERHPEYKDEIYRLLKKNRPSLKDTKHITRNIVANILYNDGFSEKEIAACFNVSESTISRDLTKRDLSDEEIEKYCQELNIDLIIADLKAKLNQQKNIL